MEAEALAIFICNVDYYGRTFRMRRILLKAKKRRLKGPWTIYMLECGNSAYYTGITNDLEHRIRMHSTGRGARYTRVFGVRGLVYTEKKRTIGAAMRREREIKRLSRTRKLQLAEGWDQEG